MTQPIEQRRYTVEEYFELEEHSDEKYEYWDGYVVPLRGPLAMSGGSYAHSLIAMNVAGALRDRYRGGPCRVTGSDLRVKLRHAARFVYPDVSVVCGPPELDPRDKAKGTVLNPRLIVEVLSPSTQSIDRNQKLKNYLQIESLEEYLLVSQDAPRVESFFRQPGGSWLFTPVDGVDGILKVRSMNFEIPLREIFEGVEFPAETDGGI